MVVSRSVPVCDHLLVFSQEEKEMLLLHISIVPVVWPTAVKTKIAELSFYVRDHLPEILRTWNL